MQKPQSRVKRLSYECQPAKFATSRNELVLSCRERRSGDFRLDGLRLALTGRARQDQSTVTKVLKAEEEHNGQQNETQQRTDVATTAGSLGFKIGILYFGQETPFPSGTMARSTMGRETRAWRWKLAIRLTHWDQEKSGGGRWKEGARLGSWSTGNERHIDQQSRRSEVGAIQDRGNALRQAVMTL